MIIPPELVEYHRIRQVFRGHDLGKIAVIHESKLLGLFQNRAEACAAVNQRQGQGRFLIKEVGAPEDFLFLGKGPVEVDTLPEKGCQLRPETDPLYFEWESNTYRHHCSELEQTYPGKAVLIYGDQLIGVYNQEADALCEGRERYGLEKIYVHVIGEDDVPLVASQDVRGPEPD